MRNERMSRGTRWLEWTMLGIGTACVVWYAGIHVAAEFLQSQQRATLGRMVASRELPADAGRFPSPPPAPDPGLVMTGDEDHVLRFGIGYLSDTPLPWQDGNSALAGHRDGVFRPLRNVRIGDDIRLVTPHGEFRYRVRRTLVVGPEEVWVLGAVPRVNLTLITCFPFSYIGRAPQRFVVQAEKIQPALN
jgi:sortase A